MILNEYSKTAWIDGASPSMNKVTLDNLEQGVYDVTAKAMELAAYETNAAASATSANASAVSAAASAASIPPSYTDLAQDVTDLTTVVANHAKWSTTEEVVIGTFNGKPLYRISVIIPNLPSTAGTTSYTHNIANIAYILKYHAMYTNGTNFFQEENLTSAISTLATKTNIQIGVNANRSAYSGTVWLEYTKTTD